MSVGGEDVGGGGPSEDADDVASGFTNDAGGCVPQLPAQPFGQRPGQGPVTQSSWNQRTRSAPQHTTASHAALAAKSVNGNRNRPESLSRPMWSSTWAVGPHLAVQGGGVAVLVGVVAPNRYSRSGRRLVWAPGCSGSRRTDQPGPFRPGGQVDQVGDLAYHGHLVVSVVLVDGCAGVPSWLRAGTHRSLSVLATATAAETAVFRRPPLRSRCCGTGSRPRTRLCSPPSPTAPSPGGGPRPRSSSTQ